VKKLGIIALVMVLLSPILPLMLIGMLVSPASNNCAAGGTNIGDIPDSLDATLEDGTRVTLDATQLTHAATIILTGARTPQVTRDAITIALIAALTESRLRNLANTSAYPESADYDHDGDGSDHDSLGLFQMRHQSGWGSVKNLMDPVYQAKAFYGGPTGPNHGSPRGLLDIPNWQNLTPGQAAQAVEVSAYPDRYDNWQPVAQTILDTLTKPNGGSESNPPSTSTVIFPLPAGTWVKTSDYGWRIHPISHTRKFHAGVDYAAKDGTPIMAIADGVVTFSGAIGGYGHAIDIKHNIDGVTITSRYGHMWSGHLYVKTGDHVVAGQHIGDVGSDGVSTGPHLHFEIHLSSGTTDPVAWLASHNATNLDQPGASTSGCYM